MKILLLTSIYPEPEDYKVPADTLAIHYFSKEFVRQGHEVVVCHLYSNPISRLGKMRHQHGSVLENTLDGVHVCFSSLQIYVPHKYSGSRFAQIRNARRMKNHLEKQLKFTPEIIFVHYPTTFLDYCEELIGNQYASCILHNTDLTQIEKQHSRGHEHTERRIKALFHNIGFRSQQLLERGKLVGIANNDSPVILSGIPNKLLFSKDKIGRKINTIERNTSLLFVGKLNEQKRVNVIIKALGLCKEFCTLDIIGEGPQKGELLKLAKDLNLVGRVRFLGAMPREDVSKIMYEKDIFVMVSKAETLGLVYIEAMAAGCITIGSKGEGIDGLIKNNINGFLVEPDNEEKLSKVIDYIISAPKDVIDIVRLNGFTTAESLTDELAAKKYLNYLSGVGTHKEETLNDVET